MSIRDYDPASGQAFQGDVSIVPVPPKLATALSTVDEIKPVAGRLILQEGEVTGHHHAVYFRDDGLARHTEAADLTAGALAAAAITKAGSAHLYRDQALASLMVSKGPLARADLVVGFLHVEGAPIVIRHEEHDGIRVPPGLYCIGRQVESAGAEERRVAD